MGLHSHKNTYTITFCSIWDIFIRKQGGVTSQRGRIKIWQIPFHLHDSWSTSCKKNLIQIFSSFAAIDRKGHFRKILTRIFKFGSFYWYLHFLKTIIKLPDAEFNAELIDTDFKSQKWKTKTFVCPFLIALFYFKTNLIK